MVLSYQVLWFQDVRGKPLPAFLKCISTVWAEGTHVPSLLSLLIPAFTKQPRSTQPCCTCDKGEPSVLTSAPLPADFPQTIHAVLQTGNPGVRTSDCQLPFTAARTFSHPAPLTSPPHHLPRRPLLLFIFSHQCYMELSQGCHQTWGHRCGHLTSSHQQQVMEGTWSSLGWDVRKRLCIPRCSSSSCPQDTEDSVALVEGRASDGRNWDLRTTMWPRLQPLKKKLT